MTRPQRTAAELRLRLFIAGQSPNSVAALRHLRSLLARQPSVQAELEVLDVLQHPELAVRDRVLVTPMMIKLAPGPERRIYGTLEDTAALASVLGLTDST